MPKDRLMRMQSHKATWEPEHGQQRKMRLQTKRYRTRQRVSASHPLGRILRLCALCVGLSLLLATSHPKPKPPKMCSIRDFSGSARMGFDPSLN